MAIHQMNRYEFDVYGIERNQLALFSEEREWYRNTEKSVLGVILYDKSDKVWNCALFRREGGDFGPVPAENCFGTLEEAQKHIREEIRKLS